MAKNRVDHRFSTGELFKEFDLSDGSNNRSYKNCRLLYKKSLVSWNLKFIALQISGYHLASNSDWCLKTYRVTA